MSKSILQTSLPPSPELAAVEALYYMGYSLLQQERHAEAAEVLRLMLRLAPQDERSWLALGECHARAGHDLVALELYSAGTLAADGAARCALARSRMLHALGRVEEAEEAFAEALEFAERDADDELVAMLNQERRAQS